MRGVHSPGSHIETIRRRRHELASTMRHQAWSGSTLQGRLLKHTRVFFRNRAGAIALLRVHPAAAQEVLAIRDRELEERGPLLARYTEESFDHLLWFATASCPPWRDGASWCSVATFPYCLLLDRTPAGVDVLACVAGDFAMRVDPERFASLVVLEGLRKAEQEYRLGCFGFERVPADEAEAARTDVARSVAELLRNVQRGRSDPRNRQRESALFRVTMRLPYEIECKGIWRSTAWGPELEELDLHVAADRVVAEVRRFVRDGHAVS